MPTTYHKGVTMKIIDTPAYLTDEVYQMLEAHLTWLKGWDERNAAYTTLVAEGLTLDDYWLKVTPGIAKVTAAEVGSYIDQPTIYIDQTFGDRRVIVLACTPFHDEGGPAILTGFFSPDAIPGGTYEEAWGLCALVQEFDTTHSMLMSDMKLVWD